MSQSNDRLSQIADTLDDIKEHLVLLAADTERYALALQAVKTDDPISKSIIQAVIAALSRDSLSITDASIEADMVLYMSEMEVTRYE